MTGQLEILLVEENPYDAEFTISVLTPISEVEKASFCW
jgi:hypothetical protein